MQPLAVTDARSAPCLAPFARCCPTTRASEVHGRRRSCRSSARRSGSWRASRLRRPLARRPRASTPSRSASAVARRARLPAARANEAAARRADLRRELGGLADTDRDLRRSVGRWDDQRLPGLAFETVGDASAARLRPSDRGTAPSAATGTPTASAARHVPDDLCGEGHGDSSATQASCREQATGRSVLASYAVLTEPTLSSFLEPATMRANRTARTSRRSHQ